MSIEVTLAIDANRLDAGQTVATIVARVAELGGQLVGWQPELNGAPALAKFKFLTESARESFAVSASRIAGVSLAAMPSSDCYDVANEIASPSPVWPQFSPMSDAGG